MNRPFLCSKQNVRERIFSQINQLSRSVFCFFSSRKENVPLLFFLEEKKQKKVNCGAAFFLLFCRFRQHATQNGRFVCEPSVFMLQAECAGKHLFSDKSTLPQCLLFLFFKKRKRSPLKKRKRPPAARKPSPRRAFDGGKDGGLHRGTWGGDSFTTDSRSLRNGRNTVRVPTRSASRCTGSCTSRPSCRGSDRCCSSAPCRSCCSSCRGRCGR